LRFANPSPPSGWIEDFHLQAVDHARHTKKSPRPAAAGQGAQLGVRACRIGSDAARLGRVVLTKRQRRTKEEPDNRGAIRVSTRRMGSVSVWGVRRPSRLPPQRAGSRGVPSSVSRICMGNLEHRCPYAVWGGLGRERVRARGRDPLHPFLMVSRPATILLPN